MNEKSKKKLDNYHIDKSEFKRNEIEAKNYENKSEEEIYLQVIQINEEIEKEMSYEEYEILFQKLKSIRTLLNDEQNIKLDSLLKKLKKN
ncbi:MAG: hypothetical protein ACTHW2_11125 [Tissierella sp.]|uniref:hypothetical protein n=1 Tax=Tissierella sp. TaxID=41274 RepID=UPI003F964DCB